MELEGGVQLNKKLNLRLEELTPEEKVLFEEAGLTSSIEKASPRILKLLPLDRVDVAFVVGKNVIPETGEVGYAGRNWAMKKMGKSPVELVGTSAIEVFNASGWR